MFPEKATESIFPKVLEKQSIALVKAAACFAIITSVEQQSSAEMVLKESKKLLKDIEEVRMSFTRPLDQQKAALMQIEKAFTERLTAEANRLATLINGYLKEQHRLAQEEKARINAEEQARLKRLSSPVSIAKVSQEFEEKRAEVAAPTAGVRMVKRYEVVDINQVPRELLMVDEAKVKEMMQRGVNQCVGLRFWEEPIRSGR